MLTIAWILTVVAAGLLAAPYALMPLLTRAMPLRPFRRHTAGDEPTVAVLIPALDEAEALPAKLRDCVAQDWPAHKLQIWVGSDGSTDGTEAVAGAVPGVQVVVHPQRQGKASMVNTLLQVTDAELVLLTDAAARLPRDAVRRLAAAFDDPAVAVASAAYAVADPDDGEAQYWAGETARHAAAAARDLLLGAHGAAYMARRAQVAPLPVDTVNDDYVIPLRLRAQGHRVAYVPTVRVTEPPIAPTAVHRRQIRIARGNWQMLWRHRHLLSPRAGRVAAVFGLHKLAKTLSPFLVSLLVFGAGLGAVAGSRALGAAAAAGLLAIAAGAVAFELRQRGKARGLVDLLGYAFGAQLAYVQGAWGFLRGDQAWGTANDPLDLSSPATPPRRVRWAKRGLDVLGAGVGLVLSAPVVALAAVAVKLESKGPAVYRQVRVGSDGLGEQREFVMLKLRTMRNDAEAAGAQWATERDPRITRVGRFLRKTRLDELPQLWNVLKGEMSLVGPRPERPVFTAKLAPEIPGYDDRVGPYKPGVTGWAQIHCGYDTSVESVRDKLAYDLAYSAHLHSLRTWARMELNIIWRTVSVMLTGKGAH